MIKNGEFCVYNGNEYELNEDNDGNLIIITTNREIIDATFVDEYNSGVYSKIISPNEMVLSVSKSVSGATTKMVFRFAFAFFNATS